MVARTRIRRLPERAVEDIAVMEAILDEGFVCHAGYVDGGRPVVIPTLYVRDGKRLLLHGSPASGIQRAVKRGSLLCVAVTLVDGIVVARSGFNSSVRYRSVVVHGRGALLNGDDHEKALELVVEGLIPGRLADIRRPLASELRVTGVVAVPLDVFSAKVSAGPPDDDPVDLGTGVWAGVVPVTSSYGDAVPAPDLEPGVPVPDYLSPYRRS